MVGLETGIKLIVLMFWCTWAHFSPKRTSANYLKKICVLQMPEFNLMDCRIAPSPKMCLTRVSRRFQDMYTSIKRHGCTNLLSGLGYLMIESVEKSNGLLFCPAKMGTRQHLLIKHQHLILRRNLQLVQVSLWHIELPVDNCSAGRRRRNSTNVHNGP